MMPKQSINFVNLCQKGRYCKLSYEKEKLLDDSLTPSNLRHHRESYTKKVMFPRIAGNQTLRISLLHGLQSVR